MPQKLAFTNIAKQYKLPWSADFLKYLTASVRSSFVIVGINSERGLIIENFVSY